MTPLGLSTLRHAAYALRYCAAAARRALRSFFQDAATSGEGYWPRRVSSSTLAACLNSWVCRLPSSMMARSRSCRASGTRGGAVGPGNFGFGEFLRGISPKNLAAKARQRSDSRRGTATLGITPVRSQCDLLFCGDLERSAGDRHAIWGDPSAPACNGFGAKRLLHSEHPHMESDHTP